MELCEAIAAIICNLVIRLVHLTKSRPIVNVAIFAVRISNIYNLNCTNLDDKFYESQKEQRTDVISYSRVPKYAPKTFLK